MQLRQRADEQSVGGHGVIDARRREDRQIEEAERRDRNRGRDEAVAPRPEHPRRRLRRRRGRRGEAFQAERAEIHQIHEDVDHDDGGRAGEQAAGKVAARVLDLLGDVVGVLPAAVREEDGDQRGAETDRRRRTAGRFTLGLQPPVRRGCEPAGRDEDGERRDLEDDQDVQHAASRFHAEEIDDRQHDHRGDRERHCRRVRPSDETKRVIGERDRDGGDRAALDQRQQRPSVEEPGQRVVAIPQVDVLPAGARELRAQFGIGERAGERDGASRGPRRQHQHRGVEALRDDVGIDEDAGADDAADDHHRGVERAERALE